MNVLTTLAGHEPTMIYGGYGSCPLAVERGKIVLAECGYCGKIIPIVQIPLICIIFVNSGDQ